MITPKTEPAQNVTLISSEELSTLQLSVLADDIAETLRQYRPEFKLLIKLHRLSGCRVKELFQPTRWQVASTSEVKVQPQKRNALRTLRFIDIGFRDAEAFTAVLADMARLPYRQYERAFSAVVHEKNLWRLYNDGFAIPSTHLFRHVKIKELSLQGQTDDQIARWIGEKSVENIGYYLASRFFQ